MNPLIKQLQQQIKALPEEDQRTLMRRTREVIHTDMTVSAEIAAHMILGDRIKFEDLMEGLEC